MVERSYKFELRLRECSLSSIWIIICCSHQNFHLYSVTSNNEHAVTSRTQVHTSTLEFKNFVEYLDIPKLIIPQTCCGFCNNGCVSLSVIFGTVAHKSVVQWHLLVLPYLQMFINNFGSCLHGDILTVMSLSWSTHDPQALPLYNAWYIHGNEQKPYHVKPNMVNTIGTYGIMP